MIPVKEIYSFRHSDKIAVDFLIDVSGSMAFGNKQRNEKNALNSFVGRMSDSSVVGIQIFSDPNNVREVVPLSLYKNVKSQVQNTINTLPANGATSTRSAFDLARQKLSDVAGIIHNSDNCLVIAPDSRLGGTRCFAKAQDPRSPTDLPQIIKTQGVDIYSIAITDPGDQPMKNELLRLLQDASSDPDSTYFYESVDGNDLTAILGGMMTKGLVPTNVPANKGVVVTPVFNTPASNESNLQLNSFGFVSPVPTQTPAPQSSDAL
jgi:hypothetical protein